MQEKKDFMTIVPLLKPSKFDRNRFDYSSSDNHFPKNLYQEVPEIIKARESIIRSLGGPDFVRQIPVYLCPKNSFFASLTTDDLFQEGQYIVQTLDPINDRKIIIIRLQEKLKIDQKQPHIFTKICKAVTSILKISSAKTKNQSLEHPPIIDLIYQTEPESSLDDQWTCLDNDYWYSRCLGDSGDCNIETICNNLELLTQEKHPQYKFYPKK